MIEQVLTMKRTAALCLVGAFCSLNAQAQNIQVNALIQRQYVLRHGEPSFHFRIFVVHCMMIRIIP